MKRNTNKKGGDTTNTQGRREKRRRENEYKEKRRGKEIRKREDIERGREKKRRYGERGRCCLSPRGSASRRLSSPFAALAKWGIISYANAVPRQVMAENRICSPPSGQQTRSLSGESSGGEEGKIILASPRSKGLQLGLGVKIDVIK